MVHTYHHHRHHHLIDTTIEPIQSTASYTDSTPSHVSRPDLPGVQPRRRTHDGRKDHFQLDEPFSRTLGIHPLPRRSSLDTPTVDQPDRQHVLKV